MGMPGELQRKIYRLILHSPVDIVVDGGSHEEPALPQVNRQVRKENASIYYTENEFIMRCYNMAGTAITPFKMLLLQYRKPGAQSQLSPGTVETLACLLSTVVRVKRHSCYGPVRLANHSGICAITVVRPPRIWSYGAISS